MFGPFRQSRHAPRSTSLRVEELHDRVCPSATLSNGVLTITGTGINDAVSVTESLSGYVIIVRETHARPGTAPLDPQTSYFPFFSVNKVVFDGLNGDDTFTNYTGKIGIAHGGNGNDRLTGGYGADYLYGDDGNDIIFGGGGNDYLYGGNNDDDLYGGDGNDTFYGGSGADRMYGEAGNDAFDSSSDGSVDILDGGSGNDVKFNFDPLDQVTSIEVILF